MNFNDIPKEKFTFVQKDAELKEQKLTTKPTGYFQDAMIRFAKNRGSVICFFIIMILVLYSILAPFFSKYKISDRDGYYAYATPRAEIFSSTEFWNGAYTQEVNIQSYQYFSAIPGAMRKLYRTVEKEVGLNKQTWYKISIDSYAKVGWIKMLLSADEYEKALAWEKENGSQLFYPLLDENKIYSLAYKGDQNAWFLTDDRGHALLDEDGNFKDIYLRGKDGTPVYFANKMNGSQKETRVLYREWYRYKNGHYAIFLFGADKTGYDIFTRLAYGARLSLLLSICVAAINLMLGIVIGAIEGYYGGTVDLISNG